MKQDTHKAKCTKLFSSAILMSDVCICTSAVHHVYVRITLLPDVVVQRKADEESSSSSSFNVSYSTVTFKSTMGAIYILLKIHYTCFIIIVYACKCLIYVLHNNYAPICSYLNFLYSWLLFVIFYYQTRHVHSFLKSLSFCQSMCVCVCPLPRP